MQKRQFDKKKIMNILGDGSESTVYSYKEGEQYVALKVLKDEFVTPSKTEPIPYEVFLNKERKLLLLNQSDLLIKDEKPIDLYYDGDKFIGYSMFIDISKSLEDFYTSKNKIKEEYLNLLKERNIILNQNGIYIGDFNTDNFGVRKDGSIKLRDIDNYSIQGLPFDRETNLVKEYKKRCTKADNVDNYSFNYFSLGFLLAVEPRALEKYLEKKGLPNKYDTEENRQLLNDLENIDDNYEPRYFIDSKKKRLFFK